jgi:hypothetical protein
MISDPAFLPDIDEMRARMGIAVAPVDRAQRTREAFPPSGPAVTPQVMQARAMPAPRVGEIGGGIDVRSYTGSMWSQPGSPTAAQGPGADLATLAAQRIAPNGGQPAAQRDAQGRPMPAAGSPMSSQSSTSPQSSTLLPTGNPMARDAVLRSQFPNASPGGIGALGNMAWNRPGEFNAAMAGTRLDPTMANQRTRGAEADIAGANARTAATIQGTGLQAEEAQRRLRGDAAMESFLKNIYGQDLKGVPAEVAQHIAQLADQRSRKSGFPTAEAALESLPPGVNGQVQFVNGTWTVQGSQAKPATPRPINDRASRIDRLNQAMAAAKTAGNAELARIYATALKTESEGYPSEYQRVMADQTERDGAAETPDAAPATPVGKPGAKTSPSAWGPDGRQLKGPDGAMYIVKNGKPVKQ